MPENFSILVRDINLQIQETENTLNRTSTKHQESLYLNFEELNTKQKRKKNWKKARRK